MKLRKIVTLGLLCTLGLVACSKEDSTPTSTPAQPSTVEPKPSTGDSTTTEKPANRDAVYNVLSKLKTTKAASINYTLDGEEYTDIFNKDYVMFNRFGQGVALLPSYDPSETRSNKAVYMFEYNDTDIVLDKVMADRDQTTGALIYETSIDDYNNAYQIGRQISKNRLSVDKDSGDIYTTNTTLLKTIAGAVGFQYATLVQGGTAYFYLSEDETSVEVSLTAYYKKSADSTGTKVLTEEFDPIYFNDIGTAVSDTFGDVLADGEAFLGASLTDDEISNVVSKPVKYHTPLSSMGYAEVAYGTKDGQNIASTHQVVYSGKDADGKNLVGKESMGYYVGDSTQVKYMTLTAANEVYDSGALTSDSGQKYTWDIAIADLSNTEVFNPKAFRKVNGSDDTYKYLGYSVGAENIFYGLSFLSADDFGGEYNSLSVTLGSNDKVESFNYTVAFRDSSTGSIQGGITFKTTIENGDSVAPTLPTAYTQEAEENKIAEGLKKLNGSVSFSMTSSMTVEGTSLNAISTVYYYDKTNKSFIVKQSSGSNELVRGWKEATDNAVTPFKIEDDNSLTARNVDIEGHITKLFTPALSPALLKKKLGSENDYVLRTTLATGISSSMLFGPAGNEGMIPSTIVFHTDNDGTIQSISYTYSIYNSSKSAYERGTETLTFAYDTAAVNPTTADLSSAIKAYVKPTSWKEQSEAIYKDIVSAIGETEAATVPFLFDSNFAEDGWASKYANGYTMIVGSASSSSVATTFLTNYLTYVQKQGFQYGGPQSGIYVFLSPNSTYVLGITYSNGSPIILIEPASAN